MLPVTSLRQGYPLLAARRSSRAEAGKGPGRASCLTALILALACCVLLYETFKGVGRGSRTGAGAAVRGATQSGSRRALPDRRFPAPRLRTLVLVACHSVYTGLDFSHPEDQSSWLMLDYQKEVPGQAGSFVEHIKMGVAHAATDPAAMLLFSGGKTRRDAGPRAEAMGYWLVAEANQWFGHATSVRGRAFTEEHARDSLENVVFGLCRFYELTGHYPDSLLVVGYEFKRERFAEQHRAALRWPTQEFQYVGTPALTADAAEGEAKTAAAFEADPYGCYGELAVKRAARDPFADGGYTGERCPALAGLLEYCGPHVYSGPLPWDQRRLARS